MANRFYSNTAVNTTLTAGISNSITTPIPIASTTGFPVSFPYTCVIDQGTASEELVSVTAAAGLNLTVTRGHDGTAAVTHSSGASFKHVASAQDFREPQDHIALTAAHGATGAVMGTTNTQAVTNKDLSSLTNTFPSALSPVGSMTAFAGSAAPTGWQLCDGTALNRTTFAALFAVCGTLFGAGDGSTTFNVPNFKGRVPVGIDAGQTEFDVRGETGGAKTHALSAGEMPAHTHVIDHGHSASSGTVSSDHSHSGSTAGASNDHSHALGISDAGGLGGGGSLIRKGGVGGDNSGGHSSDHSHAFTTGGISANHTHAITVNSLTGSSGSAGSGSAHNNLQPYLAVHWIIKT